jgi:protease IV
LKRFLVGFLATVGVLTLLLVAIIGGGVVWLVRSYGGPEPLPDDIVLTVDLGETLSEARSSDPFATLGLQQPLEVAEFVLALERASLDPRVKGLVARLDATGHGFAVAQELREAVRDFSQSGKPTAAWADSFGELGPGNEGYFIATAFGSIYLQPGGMLGLTGLIAEVPFVRPLLDRLGIEPQISRRSAYKTAFDSLIEPGLTDANREMLNDLLDGLYATQVEAIAEGRGQTPETVRRLIDNGPFMADDALEAGLVDALAFRDEVIDQALESAGPEAELVALELYARRTAPVEDEAAAVIALVVGQGAIQRGSAGFEQLIGADDLADQLAAAREDEAIAAVVLRLDTGGGSAVASETIAREVALLRDAGKPVVVSMSNAAASGGYWIAMGASYIVAQPTTLTGSIGVIAGKPVLAGAWDLLGVSWESVERGENAAFLSFNQPFDSLGRARLEASIDALYARFKAGVAAGRGLEEGEVEAIAQGRVWLGAQALGHGLVDELGGIRTARSAAIRLLDLPEDAPVELRRYPERAPAWEQLLELVDQPWVQAAATAMAWWRGLNGTGPVEAQLPHFR